MGEMNIKRSIPNPTPECTSCAPMSDSHIGEALALKLICWLDAEQRGRDWGLTDQKNQITGLCI